MSVAEDVGAGVLLTAAGLELGWLVMGAVRGGLRRHGAEHRVHDRARQARAALVEAAVEDPWFAPEEVNETVDAILAAAVHVWREGKLGEDGSRRPDGAYIERWARSVAADAGEGVRLTGKPTVDVLGVTDREGEAEDRIVLRVRLRIQTGYPGQPVPSVMRGDLRWTLGRRRHAWSLLSIDADPLADPLFERPLVPVAWADDERLREASLAELGQDDAAPRADLSDLVVPHMAPSQQLVELAQLDGRFDPELLSARLQHIVEAWEQASMGAPEPLSSVASPQTVATLLYPPSRTQRASTRLVLRDAVVRTWEATELSISASPYRVAVEVVLTASAYLVRWPQGTYLAGDVTTRRQMILNWTLALSDAVPATWQLVSANDPAASMTVIDDLHS